MKKILEEKFKNEELRTLLCNTRECLLVEENTWHDTFWGKCICSEHGYGYNTLGEILMLVRDNDPLENILDLLYK